MDMAPFIRLRHPSSEEAQNPASPLPSQRRGEFVLTERHHEGWLHWRKHKGGRTESGTEQHLGTAPGTSSVLELGPEAPAGLGQGQQGDPCTPATRCPHCSGDCVRAVLQTGCSHPFINSQNQNQVCGIAAKGSEQSHDSSTLSPKLPFDQNGGGQHPYRACFEPHVPARLLLLSPLLSSPKPVVFGEQVIKSKPAFLSLNRPARD